MPSDQVMPTAGRTFPSTTPERVGGESTAGEESARRGGDTASGDARVFAENALRALHAEHGPALLAYLTHLTKDRRLAEDILQETLIRAWLDATRLKPECGSVRRWLFTVAHNIAVDQWRARRVRVRESRLDLACDTSTDTSAEASLERVLTAVHVLDALKGLRREYRTTLFELYYNDRTAAETAKLLGIPEGTVKSRAHHAMRKLREALT